MKTIKYFLVLMLAACITSCGEDPNEFTLKVEANLGDLGNYIDVDDKVTIKMEEVEEDGDQKIVLTSSFGINVNKSVASNYDFEFDAEILDKDHIKIADFPDYEIESNMGDTVDDGYILSVGKKWSTAKENVKKERWKEKDQEMWDKIREKGVYLHIAPRWSSSKFVEYKGTSDKSELGISESVDLDVDEVDEIENDTETSSAGSEDWDALLNSYEEYVDKYISYLKKASKGDMTALSEYPSMMEKAQEFSKKMKNARSDMSAAQWAKYNKITMKMLEAAQQMKE